MNPAEITNAMEAKPPINNRIMLTSFIMVTSLVRAMTLFRPFRVVNVFTCAGAGCGFQQLSE
jgi:hypothetical protein